ncbi:MAG: hypothetical protein ACM31F_07275 [Gemmatimonas sp.]
MRGYTVRTVAVTLGVPVKWVDNVLSHHRISGVSGGRQGVARRLSMQAVLILEIALRLIDAFGLPLTKALELAARFVSVRSGKLTLAGQISLLVDMDGIEGQVTDSLAQAVEIAPSPRRGRPPATK